MLCCTHRSMFIVLSSLVVLPAVATAQMGASLMGGLSESGLSGTGTVKR